MFTVSEIYGFLRHVPIILSQPFTIYCVCGYGVVYGSLLDPRNRGLGVSFPGSEPFPEKQEGSQDTADYHRNYQH